MTKSSKTAEEIANEYGNWHSASEKRKRLVREINNAINSAISAQREKDAELCDAISRSAKQYKNPLMQARARESALCAKEIRSQK